MAAQRHHRVEGQTGAIHTPVATSPQRDTAVIQSAESSNRIEGVTVAPPRLYPLVLGSAKPRDRCEQEVQDYRRALNEIHSDYAALSITPDTLQRLHALLA
ncbi:MAG: hypothetical protein OXE49_20610 [Gemmatimonadetes bacterium]|nr:hypothetical protein [Gemmatimonadota bacterium]